MTTIDPKSARRYICAIGSLFLFMMSGIVAWELWTGVATSSEGRRRSPTLHASRSESPTRYWEYIRKKAIIGVVFGGGIIVFGQGIFWLNKRSNGSV